ncbi:MAG TPA: 7-carboxy-7-deazaguanine synthase QueE [Candidatus Glassbacteria bacterium]|nr:7-carboxy-7-deazaguanine synthase QueE [Candidatus Glassbacteria bacterium]
MSEVKLIENFVSWQGEGPDSGRAMAILRFKTCDRKCSWCDTAVKMRISAEAPYKISDIQKILYEAKAGILITGGEPTVARHFDECVMLLNELSYPVANVESNGHALLQLVKTVKPNDFIKYIYSPKIFNEKDLDLANELTENIVGFPNVHIKVVYEDNPLVIKYLDRLHEHYENLAWQHRIWLMPEGTTRTDLIRNAGMVFDACERYKFNFSSRSHIIFGFV